MATETKNDRKKGKKKNSGGGFLGGIRTYFNEVRTELNKVSWPDREDVIRLTRIVIIATILASIALGLMSIILTAVMTDYGLNAPWVFVVIFAAIILVTVINLNDALRSRLLERFRS